MAKADLTAARLRELLTYDPKTGVLRWNAPKYPARPDGVAGTKKPNGYVYIGVDGGLYLAHRLAFVLMTGEWPKHCIDHIDGNPLNNRWENLRDVTHPVNVENQRRPMSTSKTGTLGVVRFKNRFRAYISQKNRSIYLGTFKTEAEAHQAYLHAKRLAHAGCTI